SQAAEGMRAFHVTGVQTCARSICYTSALLVVLLNTKNIETMVKTIFYLKTDKENNDGELPIYCKITYKNTTTTMSSGKWISRIKIGRASCRERAETCWIDGPSKAR